MSNELSKPKLWPVAGWLSLILFSVTGSSLRADIIFSHDLSVTVTAGGQEHGGNAETRSASLLFPSGGPGPGPGEYQVIHSPSTQWGADYSAQGGASHSASAGASVTVSDFRRLSKQGTIEAFNQVNFKLHATAEVQGSPSDIAYATAEAFWTETVLVHVNPFIPFFGANPDLKAYVKLEGSVRFEDPKISHPSRDTLPVIGSAGVNLNGVESHYQSSGVWLENGYEWKFFPNIFATPSRTIEISDMIELGKIDPFTWAYQMPLIVGISVSTQQGKATADFSHTATLLGFTVTDSLGNPIDATITSASGLNYEVLPLTAVPEPGTLTLAALGSVGLIAGTLRRRRIGLAGD